MKRLIVALIVCGCGGSDGPAAMPDAGPETIPYSKLSSYGLFTGAMADQTPAAGVVPYDVNAILFHDEALKLRFIALPPGGQIQFDPTARWTFPDGTIIVKTFYYDHDARDASQGRQLLETRLLILQNGTWLTNTYVWNDEQTEAMLTLGGHTISVTRIDATGATVMHDYRVPSKDECQTCHSQDRAPVPLGPRTRQLNRDHDYGQGAVNQLTHFSDLGMFAGPIPDPSTLDKLSDPFGTDPIDKRARSYLDVNCAHCHNEAGQASNTGLHFNWEETMPLAMGICKHPVAAGPGAGSFTYDIVPGMPDQSIVPFRMQSTDPQIKMPQGPSTEPDVQGLQVISDWIAGMSPTGCP